MASFQGSTAPQNGISPYGDVVEIGLLLPANWAHALVALSRQRQQSVGQILRGLIGQALTTTAQIQFARELQTAAHRTESIRQTSASFFTAILAIWDGSSPLRGRDARTFV